MSTERRQYLVNKVASTEGRHDSVFGGFVGAWGQVQNLGLSCGDLDWSGLLLEGSGRVSYRNISFFSIA